MMDTNDKANEIVRMLIDSGLPQEQWFDVLTMAKQKIDLLKRRKSETPSVP